MTATTAMPDAVLICFALNWGSRVALCSSGSAAMISTSFGNLAREYFIPTCLFNVLRFTSLPDVMLCTRALTMSEIARMRACKAQQTTSSSTEILEKSLI
jgi:hypothetical protein